MSVVFVVADPTLPLALALTLLIFGDAIYCIQTTRTHYLHCRNRRRREEGEDEAGLRRGEQRNQATTGYELKKKRRSRIGNGINSRDPLRRAETRRWRPASRDGGSSPAADE